MCKTVDTVVDKVTPLAVTNLAEVSTRTFPNMHNIHGVYESIYMERD